MCCFGDMFLTIAVFASSRRPAARMCTTRLAMVVVDVDYPAGGCRALGDFVRVAGGRIPVPMSANCLIAASAARKRTVRARKARLARTENTRFGYDCRVRSPSSLSAAKLSFPPS
jgi:hypothetical protein